VDEAVFRALADPSRRTLLDRLYERDGQTLGELEAALPAMSRFGVMKHLRVLEDAGLVSTRRAGREKHHYLNPVPIREIHDRWLDKFRAREAAALLGLKHVLEDRSMTVSVAAPPAHVYTVYIRSTPDAIWRALTESEFTTRYFYGSSIESDFRPGSAYRMLIGDELQIDGEIVEAVPSTRLVQTFHAVWDEAMRADPISRVTWELAPGGDGITKLTVVHEDVPVGSETEKQTSGGWPFILSGLKTLLETGQPLAA
jgi:uncharacterized protein YndB with AHSA1/START domain/DNA-binding transcriptional ArsR family regulator